MRARAKQAEQYKYNGITTGEFAERTGMSPQQVVDLIASGWFGWDGDKPEALNVASKDAKIPSWRILPSAVQRFYDERAASPKKGKAA